MDLIEASTRIVGSLAWPIAAVMITGNFREEIKALLRRVRGLKGLGGELVLDALIEEKKSALITQGEKVIEAGTAPNDQRQQAVAEYQKVKSELENLIMRREFLTRQLPDNPLGGNLEILIKLVIEHFGIEEIADTTVPKLQAEWTMLCRTPPRPGDHELNGGLLTGLGMAGICNRDLEITKLGAEILIATAKQMRAVVTLSAQNPGG